MASPAHARYAYSPLPTETSIRVLKVLPRLQGEDQLLRCAIKVIDLQSDSSYDCLSYTWGDPSFVPTPSYVVDNLDPTAVVDEEVEDTDEHQQCSFSNGLSVEEDEVFKIMVIDDDKIEHYAEVRENLRDALLQLSRGDAIASPLAPLPDEQLQLQEYTWVDAICIDQSNVVERAQQVSMMHKIYSKAVRVVIWLGKFDLLDLSLFENLVTLSSAELVKEPGKLPSDIEDPEICRMLGIRQLRVQEWYNITDFLQRKWFGRVWVVQETLAARSMSVLYGPHVLSWTKLTSVSRILRDTGVDRVLLSDAFKSGHVAPDVRAHTGYVERKLENQYVLAKMKEDKAGLKIHEICRYARAFLASEVRDVVFAFTGLWKRPLHHQDVYSLKPDYRKSVAEVFTAVSWAIIQEQQDLSILSQVEDVSFRKQKSLPSWVPDWSVPLYARPLIEDAAPVDMTGNWEADKGLHFPDPLTTNPDCLLVEGVRLSNVVELAGTKEEIDNEFVLKTLLTLYANLPSEYPSGCTSIDALCRTLVKDAPYDSAEAYHHGFGLLVTNWVWEMEMEMLRDEPETRAPSTENHPPHGTSQQSSDIREKYRVTQSLIQKGTPEHTTNGLTPSWNTIACTIAKWDADSSEEDSPDLTNLEQYQERYFTAYGGRRLFRTSNNYIGLAPRSVKHDDEVWVLAGSSVPLILRSTPSKVTGSKDVCRRVVGGAYVHGIMYGELPIMHESRIERFLLK